MFEPMNKLHRALMVGKVYVGHFYKPGLLVNKVVFRSRGVRFKKDVFIINIFYRSIFWTIHNNYICNVNIILAINAKNNSYITYIH